MKMKFGKKIWLSVLSLVFGFVLSACASGPEIVSHSFSFNTMQDSPNYEVLAYKYGDGLMHSTSSDSAIRQFGKSFQAPGVSGPMPLGDRLYVKWRNKNTDHIFEKTVNLKPLLPKDMTRQGIYFVVAEGELFVYRIDPVPRPKDWPVVGPKIFQYEKVWQIFP